MTLITKTVQTVLAGTAAVLMFISCGGKKSSAKAESMEQIYMEQGRPVHVRTVKGEPFSVYLKYPAEYNARSQSTAYAKVTDVVRNVSVHVGSRVVRDQVVVTFSLDNASYQQAKLQLDNAESTYNRIKALYAQAGVSKQDYDNAYTQYEVAKETFKSASEMIQVKAPIDGTITQLNVRPSSNVNPGMALFTVSNQDGYEAYFYVLPEEINDIRAGERALITQGGETAEGRVTEVAMTMDAEKKAFPAKAFFAGKTRTLVSGMNVDVAVEVYHNEQSITISQAEMVRSGSVWSAFVVKNGTAVKRPLTLSRQEGIVYEVAGGLSAGDVLITDGAQNVTENEKVRIVDASQVAETAQENSKS